MKSLHRITFVLAIIGALNWGLVGIGDYMGSNWNVINLLLGSWSWLEDLVYVLVGLSAIYLISDHKNACRVCGGGGSSSAGSGSGTGTRA